MEQTVKNHQLVADSVCKKAGGFGDLEPWVRQTLSLFPVPSADLAGPLFEALLRVARAVPWLEEALGDEVVERLVAVVDRLTTEETVERADAVDSLIGSYDLAGTMVGTEAMPMQGPESLRAALWVCHAHWSKAGARKSGVVDAFAAAIRNAVKNRSSSATENHPVAKHLAAIGKSSSLEGFLAATGVFLTSEQASIRGAWEPISSHLAGLQDGNNNAPLVRPSVRKQPVATGFDEDEEIEALISGVRRMTGQPDGKAERLPGEPAAETASPFHVSPLTGTPSNPDASRMAKYKARQVVWNQNSLLLTNHPDVLPAGVLKKTLKILVEELHATDDADLRLGLAGLLLEAVTGRTRKSLAAIKLVDRFGRDLAGNCELSLAESAFRLRVFFAQDSADPNGYFRPTDEQAKHLEPAAETFLLPLPTVVSRAVGGRGVMESLLSSKAKSLEGWIRDAAGHVSQILGMRITAGQVRRSFSAHLFESCRDTALTQLICADTLGQSEAPSHYYAPRASYVSGVYWTLLTSMFGIDGPGLVPGNSEVRVGSRLLVRQDVAREMTSSLGAILHTGVEKLVSDHQIARVHEAMVAQMGCMLMTAGTHRPVDALFQLKLTAIDRESGAALFQDKVHDAAHDPRLVALPSCVLRQLKAYLAHLAGLAGSVPKLDHHIRDVMAGRAPLLFAVDDSGQHFSLSIASFTASLPPVWRELPLNWGRTWVRTRSIELGLAPELASIELGHLEAVGYPFSNGSPTEPAAFISAIRPFMDRVAAEQGWVVRHGIGDGAEPDFALAPLRVWASSVRKHEQAAKDLAKAWRENQKARMKDYRRRAEEYVFADKAIVEAGIDVLHANKAGPWSKHSLTKVQAEALRDAMFEDAGDDTALGLARADALHRILRLVNKRVGMQGQEPARLVLLRRPVDNAFVPEMMEAVRQVRALRDAALKRSDQGPGNWKDFALACARVAHALTVFGFCDDPAQIEGVLAHRSRLARSAALDDAVLAPWGPDSSQVLGLRGLAALAVARLAKKYPGQAVPSRQEINKALATLLPDWAVPTGRSAANDRDLLALLCETVSVANRFELSPAARLALHPESGSVCAHPLEQIALLDADPVYSLKRDWEYADSPTAKGPEVISGKRTGNARSQYLAICGVIPAPGKDLELPLTGQKIAAGQVNSAETRSKVIAELKARLALTDAKTVLQPIVRLLATWVLEMFEKGTQAKPNPADRTVSTYLTRIGGGLVDIFGNSSLTGLDDAELEDAYLAVVEAGHSVRDKAAAAVLDFHDCCSRIFGLPELDLSEVRAYLSSERRSVDGCLVLKVERDAAVSRLIEHGENPASGMSEGRQYVRVVRQAAAAMPLYAFAGARRSEVLGMKFADVVVEENGVAWARIRANRSRRLKTHAARRTVQLLEAVPRLAVEQFAGWVNADRSRLHRWRHEGAYVFSPLESGRLATGRSAIANACLKGLAEVTGRRQERLHRLRHLVAYERITPLVLPDLDRDALGHVMPQMPLAGGGVVLPRDLAAQVITLGHAHWVTTLRCYYHLPWLLRSNADAVIRMRYMNRRGAAAVMGLTLPAVDRISQQSKPTPAARAWLDHALAPRVLPKPVHPPITPEAGQSSKRWKAVELGWLLGHVERTGSLESTLTVMGGHPDEAVRIRKEFLSFERRLGRRLVGGEWLASVDMPRRTVRDLSQASSLEGWWKLLDDGPEDDRKRVSRLAAQVFDWMAPGDGDAIRLETEAVDTLVKLLVKAGFPESEVERQPLELDYWAIRVVRPAKPRPKDAHHETTESDATAKRYLGLAVKRALGVIWVANRISNVE